MDNLDLELFLKQMGILEKKTLIEDLEDILDPRHICLQKGYFNDPRDENGEVPF